MQSRHTNPEHIGIASYQSEDEHRPGARHAGSPSDLLSRATDACRALATVRVAPGSLTAASARLVVVFFLFALISVGGGLGLSFASAEASVVIHDVNDVVANYTSQVDGKLFFTSPAGQEWELVTDINDPDITNRGDGSFHPFASDVVEKALAQVSYPTDGVSFEVFILPYPRRGILESSASPGAMFLSPGVLECSAELVHFTVVHELGHIVHRRFMPDENGVLWQKYRELRHITDVTIYNTTAIHKNRPTEIFAEDFRFLFGSALANYSGTIENSSLPLPTTVVGLKDFMLSLVNSTEGGGGTGGEASSLTLNSFPNPFNPVLNVTFNFGPSSPDLPPSWTGRVSNTFGGLLRAAGAPSAGSTASPQRLFLGVFDVTGKLVRTLLDEELSPGSYSAVWTGTDERGNRVSSGIYFLKLDVGGQTATKKVILSR